MLLFGLGGRVRGLTDRRAECGVLDGLVEAVCAGESRVLVVHGEPGVSKTALLEYPADRATQQDGGVETHDQKEL